ncbi:hypothetical protein Tco_0857103 [Tanacetum coccineum]|uniref:Uncharacterized protein n=1 Tax=Tanacetum coccineum TaxID=301880 RepID=A0ABQ5B604_9ASTR
MVRVEYEWEPPRCGVCMVFGHDDMLCLKRAVEKPKEQHINHDGFQHPISSCGTNMVSKVLFKLKKPVWQAVSKKNSANSSGTKKNSEMPRKMMSFANPFDALDTIEEGDELGSNGGSSNSGMKFVQDVVGSASVSLDPLFGDYIELSDLNVPLELRRDQVDDLMPTIEEGEVFDEFRARNDARMVSEIFGYPSDCDHDRKIHIDCAHNLKFACMIVLEDMDAYRDE